MNNEYLQNIPRKIAENIKVPSQRKISFLVKIFIFREKEIFPKLEFIANFPNWNL